MSALVGGGVEEGEQYHEEGEQQQQQQAGMFARGALSAFAPSSRHLVACAHPPGCACEGRPPAKRARRGEEEAVAGGGGAGGDALPPASRLERELERALRQFTAIRSVSADPGAREECFRGAKFLLRLLEGMGAEVKLR